MISLTKHHRNGEQYYTYNGCKISIPPREEEFDFVINSLEIERDRPRNKTRNGLTVFYYFFEKNLFFTLSVILGLSILIGSFLYVSNDPVLISQLNFAKSVNDPIASAFKSLNTFFTTLALIFGCFLASMPILIYRTDRKYVKKSNDSYEKIIQHFKVMRDKARIASDNGRHIDLLPPPEYEAYRLDSLNRTFIVWVIFSIAFSVGLTVPYGQLPLEITEKEGVFESFGYSEAKNSYILTYKENGRTNILVVPQELKDIRISNDGKSGEKNTFKLHWRTYNGRFKDYSKGKNYSQYLVINLPKGENVTLVNGE